MTTINIVLWTMTGNTQIMADCIAEGAKSAGATVKVYNVCETTPDQALAADILALGCPAMGNETLEENEFQPFFAKLLPHLSGRRIALFGSYGWGGGIWMQKWQETVTAAGATLITGQGLIACGRPDDNAMTACETFGYTLATTTV